MINAFALDVFFRKNNLNFDTLEIQYQTDYINNYNQRSLNINNLPLNII